MAREARSWQSEAEQRRDGVRSSSPTPASWPSPPLLQHSAQHFVSLASEVWSPSLIAACNLADEANTDMAKYKAGGFGWSPDAACAGVVHVGNNNMRACKS